MAVLCSLFLLLMQNVGLSAIDKLIIMPLDMVVVTSAHPGCKVDQYKEGLRRLHNIFPIHTTNHHLGVIAYANGVRTLVAVTGNPFDVKYYVDRYECFGEDKGKSRLDEGLRTARFLWENATRSNSLKVTVVLLNTIPTEESGIADYAYGIEHSMTLKKIGLVVIAYDNEKDTLTPKTRDYLKTLATRDYFFQYNDKFTSTILVGLLPEKIVEIACSPKRLCRYSSRRRDECESVWHVQSKYMPDEKCWKLINRGKPELCSMEDCQETCDANWPWEEKLKCHCRTGLKRDGPNPMPLYLNNCLQVRPCPSGCGELTNIPQYRTGSTIRQKTRKPTAKITETEEDPDWTLPFSTTVTPKSKSIPLWIIGCAALILLMVIIVISFVVAGIGRCRRQDEKTILIRAPNRRPPKRIMGRSPRSPSRPRPTSAKPSPGASSKKKACPIPRSKKQSPSPSPKRPRSPDSINVNALKKSVVKGGTAKTKAGNSPKQSPSGRRRSSDSLQANLSA